METLAQDSELLRIFDGYIAEAERVFRRRIMDEGVVLTGETLDSFRTEAATAAGGYIEAKLHAAGTFRMKDLRSMDYARMPPQAGLENFVEKVGVDKFLYVPGYKKGTRPISDTVACERIAWGIRMMRRKYPNVKRGYRGIYSDPLLTEILPKFYSDLRTAANTTAMRQVKILFNQED